MIIETSTKQKGGRLRRRPVEVNQVDECGLDALAKLLVHHLEADLKDILK